jgi:hypothetical protein
VSLLDEHGNRAEAPADPQVTATHGELGVPERHGPGTYRLTYQSPLAAQEYRDVVRARFGPLEGVANVRVRARGGIIVVAPKLGLTVGTGDLASPQAGLEVGFWLPQLSRSVGLVLEARWFGFGSTDQVPAGAGSITFESEASFAALEASVAWRRPLGRGMLWLGAGGGAVLVSTTASTSGQPDIEASGWAPSGHASVGWGLPFGPGIPFGELKLAAQGDAEAGAVRGAIQSLTLNVGYRFDVY